MAVKDNDNVTRFFNAPSLYYHAGDLLNRNETTLPESVAKKVIEDISSELSKINPSGAILDACGGIGYYSALLIRKIPTLRSLVLDLAYPMLSLGKQKMTLTDPIMCNRIDMLSGDVYNLPLRERSFDYAILFSALHLISNKEKLYEELRRTLIPYGILWILTFDLCDINDTIYHRYFPGYYDIDSKRYIEVNGIKKSLIDKGFKKIIVRKYPYSMIYKSVSDVLALVSMRPFSTFSFYSDKEFLNSFIQFKNILKDKYGDGPVVNNSRMTLVAATS